MTLEGAAVGNDIGGDDADDCPRAGGGVCGDQATGHKRRRVLWSQLDPSFREPHVLVQYLGQHGDHFHSHGDRVDVRADHQPAPTRRRDFWCDARASICCLWRRLLLFESSNGRGVGGLARRAVDEPRRQGTSIRPTAGAIWAVSDNCDQQRQSWMPCTTVSIPSPGYCRWPGCG